MLVSNKPKMPTLFRVRDDITWDVVVHNWNERINTPTGKKFIIPFSQNSNSALYVAKPIRATRTAHKPGYWRNLEHRKKFLLEFANKMGFDPMIADNWQHQRYNLPAHGVC